MTPPGVEAFLQRLIPFLEALPPDLWFAVEVRNKGWLGAPLLARQMSRQGRSPAARAVGFLIGGEAPR